MAEEVKRESGRVTRAAKARATRRRIIDGAALLFIEVGYPGTTLEMIAADAGVAVQTVYFHFGNKRTVLKEVVDVVTVGDDEPIPLLDRPWVRDLHAATDPREALAIWMDVSRTIYLRVAPIMRIVRDAATSDPEMAEQWRTNQQQTVIAHRFLAQVLDEQGWLREGMDVEEAADVLFALASLELYLLLTVDRGWTPARWQRWAADVSAAAVLHPDVLKG